MLALTMKQHGMETWLLFEDDFYWQNGNDPLSMNLCSFDGNFEEDGCHIENFTVNAPERVRFDSDDVIHMRIDPPFDARYLRYLWMLRALKTRGIKVINDPDGILLHNEKLYAYEQTQSLPTFIGAHETEFEWFVKKLEDDGYEHIILKPLDLYQGIGVEKVNTGIAIDAFSKKVHELRGPVIAQPYCSKVEDGEIRSIFWDGVELGNILKVPPKGEYLSNIARGASYNAVKLTKKQKSMCEKICKNLMRYGVSLVAFDILDEYISEVNITCPGLLVEVSSATGDNLAKRIIELL